MKALKILAIAALLTLAFWLSGCTIVHLHVGDTNIEDAGKAQVGYTLPTPKVVIPTE